MEDLVASITAMSTSRMRALHTRDDPQPVLDDPWGDRLIPASMLIAAVAQRDSGAYDTVGEASEEELISFSDEVLRVSPAFANVILRSRYTEDALSTAIARGVKQYVLIGAGFDSYALRMPSQASGLKVIEVDHPATQALKLERIRECGVTVPDGVQFVAADLSSEGLDDALARSGFDHTTEAFFSWLGVTMYLSREANMATLAKIAACSAAGSQLVFSYLDQKLFEPDGTSDAALFDDLEQRVKSVGEPFVSGLYPASLRADLDALGLELQEDLNEFELVKRYDPDGINGLKPADRSHVALVRTAE